ncbi:MAG: hypothetical protein JJ878_17170 [Alphaproteobacteria bacterium]|nr:hypothetical protein [Alphaproteobacteria bacterium]
MESDKMFARVGHANHVTGNSNARTRITPVAILAIGFGDLGRPDNLAIQQIHRMKIAILGEDIGNGHACRIKDEVHVSDRQVNQMKRVLFGAINKDQLV